DELHAEGSLFEYWSHAMCFLPIEDYPLYRRRILDGVRNGSGPERWAVRYMRENPEVIHKVRAHLHENGAVRSIEFENKNRPAGGWWNWKEEKNALEALLFTGEVMIARRQKFQRVYDLRQRVLPDWRDDDLPSLEEVRRTLTLRTVHALGVALPAWIPDYYRQPKKNMPKLLEKLVNEGLLHTVQVEGFAEQAYVHPERFELLEQAASGKLEATLTSLLSPFDPLVWDRERARQLFNFDYTIECYTPAAKRRYGYFTLPILQRGRLIGRLDPKAHRSQGIFEIKSLHLEEGVSLDEQDIHELAAVLQRLADWHGTPEVVMRQSNPPDLAALLHAAI
ncbi:MAG TPA: crosslink repair DNA glycosylase YcaQ family protein, partial [Anaerolineales bacterium]|nr:crosslink repair DNA glycosylase YcaQ family protein [Anaerolineales bacterium]